MFITVIHVESYIVYPVIEDFAGSLVRAQDVKCSNPRIPV